MYRVTYHAEPGLFSPFLSKKAQKAKKTSKKIKQENQLVDFKMCEFLARPTGSKEKWGAPLGGNPGKKWAPSVGEGEAKKEGPTPLKIPTGGGALIDIE